MALLSDNRSPTSSVNITSLSGLIIININFQSSSNLKCGRQRLHAFYSVIMKTR